MATSDEKVAKSSSGVPRNVRTTINYYKDPGNGIEHAPSIAGKRSTFVHPSIDFDTVVTDITGSEDKYTLDSHGFQLHRHVSQEKEFTDDQRIKDLYYPEVEQLLFEVTGASRICIFDHTIRRPNPTAASSDDERRPVKRAHIHQSEWASENQVRRHLGEDGPRLLKSRYQLINVWRPIKTIYKDPLAVCDSHSVPDEDIVPVKLIYPDWTPEEVMFIKCYDWKTDGRARRVPHAAFTDPEMEDREPRHSIEVRALVFHEEDIVDSDDLFHIMAVTRSIVPFGYKIDTIHVMWVAALLCVVLYATYHVIYNLFVHPLAAFPGPFWARASLSEFYDMYGSGFESLCVGSERDPKRHSQMKKNLLASFSTKALAQQESIVHSVVDGFIGRLESDGTSRKGLDMTKWFEMVAFDILGEMAFGESFHCIETGKSHFWSDMIVEHLFFVTVLDNLRRYPVLDALGRRLLPRLTVSVRDRHSGYSRTKVERRLQGESGRQDFLTNVSEKVKSGEVSQEEMTAHASTLVIAGGETVATFLAAVTFFLLKNPATYLKLQHEIRSNYSSLSEITAMSAQQLPYLQAVISEGLRMYPPGSQGFPRTCPGASIDGHWVPKGTEVYTSAWTVTHDEKNFHRPYDFIPERWIGANRVDNLEASQPFSLGPRGCLGKNFAFVEINLILAKMHYAYNLHLVNEDLDWLKQSHMHVMWWKPSLNVRFERVAT
ncbi:Cytochrome P450 [Colletotrichum camelliae]|nr:Cytochrome P450 [Colletotrichum camelliae]